VGEFQAGLSANGMSVGDPVTPEDQRTLIWSLKDLSCRLMITFTITTEIMDAATMRSFTKAIAL
jgi:hypothetical protein